MLESELCSRRKTKSSSPMKLFSLPVRQLLLKVSGLKKHEEIQRSTRLQHVLPCVSRICSYPLLRLGLSPKTHDELASVFVTNSDPALVKQNTNPLQRLECHRLFSSVVGME